MANIEEKKIKIWKAATGAVEHFGYFQTSIEAKGMLFLITLPNWRKMSIIQFHNRNREKLAQPASSFKLHSQLLKWWPPKEL